MCIISGGTLFFQKAIEFIYLQNSWFELFLQQCLAYHHLRWCCVIVVSMIVVDEGVFKSIKNCYNSVKECVYKSFDFFSAVSDILMLSKTVSANHLIFPQLCQTYLRCQACWCVHCKSPDVKTTWQETIPLLRPLSGSWLSFTYMDPTARTALLVKTTVAGLLGWSLNRCPIALFSNKMVSYYRHLKMKSVMSHKAPSQSDHHSQ